MRRMRLFHLRRWWLGPGFFSKPTSIRRVPRLLQPQQTSKSMIKKVEYPYGGYDPIRDRPRLMHQLVVEKAMGKPLRAGTVVHHVNGDEADFSNSNLVVCPNNAYHRLLHIRTEALDACGNANWRKCVYCGEYDDPANMYGSEKRSHSVLTCYHRACRREIRRQRGYK